MRRALLAVFLFVALVAPAAALAADAASSSPRVRLFYYRDSAKALADLKKNYRSIDILSPQSYALDGDGALSGEAPQKAIRAVRGKGVAVVPLVTNGSFEAGAVAKLLGSPEARAAAVSAMVAEAKKRGYAGWQLDFEQVDASLRDEFSSFVAEAAKAMHAADLSLSVAVVAKVSDNPADYPNDLWQKLIGVYDYAALGQAADFVSVMSYDEPYKTGPVSPYPWLTRVLDYSLAKVPASKLSMGVPLYYWEREADGKKRIMEIGGASGVDEAARHRGAKKGYDETLRVATVRYDAKQGDPRVVWYESRRSIEDKLDLADSRGLLGFSAWALGLELPETHRAFVDWRSR